MSQTPSDILALTSEAALIVRGGKVSFANARALAMLGERCVGSPVKELLGPEVAGAQAGCFIADAVIGGQPCIVRVNRTEEGQIVFLSQPEAAPGLLNAPFLYSLRSCLMNFGVSIDLARAKAEQQEGAPLLGDLAAMNRSYYRLLRLSANASFVLGLTEGNLPFAPVRFELNGLCRSLLEGLAFHMPQLRLQAELEGEVFLAADPGMVKQLLLNLLSNCLVHGAASAISLRVLEGPASVALSVSDDGTGIPPEQLHSVFDRYRSGFGTAQMGGGPGLGLTVARGIAERHGGVLLLESRPGSGTTVRASFSKSIGERKGMHMPDQSPLCTARELFIGLADCLPVDCFGERYLD